MREEKTIPCELCGNPTRTLATKRCDRCWELERRIQSDPGLARQILIAIDGSVKDLVEVCKEQSLLLAEILNHLSCGEHCLRAKSIHQGEGKTYKKLIKEFIGRAQKIVNEAER